MTSVFLSGLMLLFADAAGATESNYVFNETFDTVDDFNKWTIIDVNGGRTWEFLNGAAAYMLDYQTGLPGDDWYISPAVKLNSNSIYELSFDLTINSSPESLKVALGTSADAQSFTTVIADYPNVTSEVSGTKKFKITVPESKDYYIGFYAYSEPNMHRIDIDNVNIRFVSSGDVPAAVTELTATAGEKGALNATVSLKAPATNAAGNNLQELTAIHLFRNDGETPVHTFEQPVSGTALSWTDNNPDKGFNTYRAVAVNSEGNSEEASVTTYVGMDVPTAVSNLNVTLNKDLSVTLEWTAPTQSAHDGYLDLSTIRYRILRNETVIEEAFEGTSYTDYVPAEPNQRLTTYKIIPFSEGGDGEATQSNEILTGTPLKIPYSESFANAQFSASPWYQDAAVHDFDWALSGDDEGEEVSTYDNDGGMIFSNSSYASSGETSRFISPIFDLSNATNPVLSFWFFHAQSPWYDPEWDGEINDRVEVQMSVDGGEWKTLENAVFYNTHDNDGWVKCEVNLPRHEGSIVNIGLLAVSDNDYSAYKNIYVDNITIDESAQQHDLAVNSFSVDSKRIDVGSKFTFTADVLNKGAEATSDYKVRLYKDGQPLMTVDGEEVKPTQSAQSTFEYTATLDDATDENSEWYVEILYDADQFAANNKSESLQCSVRTPDVPSVTNLYGQAEGNSLVLTWDAAKSIPETPKGEPVRVTDDAESYEPFIIENIGEWTTRDMDKGQTLVSPRIPNNYPHQGEPMAFQIFNAIDAGCITEEYIDDALAPHSGEQFFICPSAEYPAENDDWLISPRLDGRAQSISFFAKAASYESEWIIVYYSTTDTHPDSFIQISEGERVYVSDAWTEYSYNLPEGAKYFAIRCVRRTVFLLVDDVTYNKHDGTEDPVTLLGYNVYMNGKKLNSTPLTENRYEMENPGENELSFHVTAVYEEGESSYSNEFKFSQSGILEPMAEAISIQCAAQTVTVTAPQPVSISIYALDGKEIFHTEQSTHETVTLENGIYIVKAGNKVAKVIL